ncbi:MAG: TonB family protein [Candidatus Saccharimonadaceae bacterium]
METFLIYFAKVNIALIGLYLLYVVLFRKDTFIKIRRYYFISAILFSLAYPFLTVTALGNLIDLRAPEAQYETTITLGDMSMEGLIMEDLEPVPAPIPWLPIIKWTLLSGSLIFTIRFIWQLSYIIRIKTRSEKKDLFGYIFYHLWDEINPFSFFNWIFIHTETHTEDELKQILLHEQTHVRQWHSLDIMLVEMLRILFWWNPVVWLMKRDIAINLEYLADKAVLQKGVKTSEYQYHLLQLTYHDTAVQIVNNFNVSQLKQRIMMMNSKKSPLRKLAKYLSVLPLALLLIMANSLYAQQIEPQQENTPPQDPQKKESKGDELFIVVDKQPIFPGGTQALMNFLGENIKYPAEAVKNKTEGRVILNFVIEKDSSVSEINIERGIDPLIDAEAIRVISMMPKWEPGQQNGENVRVRFTLPIEFKIPGEDKEKAVNDLIVIGDGSMKDASSQTLAEKFGEVKPLIIIDDVKMEKEFDLNSIKPEEIESISVLKDKSAVEMYGNEGKDGVILIITKKMHKLKSPVSTVSEKLGVDPNEVFVVVEKQPEFPGGIEALMKFLGDNVKYPVDAQKKGTQGRVITNFVINKDGSISNIKIVRSVDPLLDAEASRVIAMMPNWKPGTQKGKAVNVRFTLPVIFRLSNDAVEMTEEQKEEAIKLQHENATNKLKERGPVSVIDHKEDAPDKSFFKFLSEKIKYPVIAQENGITGLVKATFDVSANGEISNVKVKEGIDPSLDAELIRVVKLFPKEIALTRTGGKAASNVKLSANFRLQNGKTSTVDYPVESDVVVVGYGNPANKK